MFTAPKPVAAVFDDVHAAHAAAADLERDGFPKPWLAPTRETEVSVSDAGEARKDLPSANEVDTTSDGAVGAIGRLFTFAGGSLVRALEDHGLEPEDATAMDRAIVRPAVVLVVDAGDRGAAAAALLRAAGGEVHGAYGRGLAGASAAFGSTFDAALRTTGDAGGDAALMHPAARGKGDAPKPADGDGGGDSSGEARPDATADPVAPPTGDTVPGALHAAEASTSGDRELAVRTTHDPAVSPQADSEEPDPLG